MHSVTTTDTPVNSMSDPLAARLKRDVAFYRAAQVLADATRCRQGLDPISLSLQVREERDWFLEQARQIIEIFERLVSDREPDAVGDARVREAAKLAVAREAYLNQERSRGHVLAAERGHELGPWYCNGTELGQGKEQANCRRCQRTATLDLSLLPPLGGNALTEGCLTPAEVA